MKKPSRCTCGAIYKRMPDGKRFCPAYMRTDEYCPNNAQFPDGGDPDAKGGK